MQSLDTVVGNGKNFTSMEFERDARTQTSHHNVRAQGIEKLKGMLRKNWIQDCPAMEKDTDTAAEIWGPDVTHPKGETMRKKPKKFVDKKVQMPPQITVQKHRNSLFTWTIHTSVD